VTHWTEAGAIEKVEVFTDGELTETIDYVDGKPAK
jgi:hypothetical protein